MVLDAPAPVASEAPEGPSDLVLVAAVRTGDDRAFEQLYSRYQRRISAYVFGMVKDYGRAEDITQDVFISALRRMRETDRAIAFKPWIYEIAKNACIDQFRRSRRAEEISMDAGEGLAHADHGRLVAGEPSPDAAVDAKQQLDHLCGAFGGLSESHHEILVLREFEGLSYREIGERMGLSRPGVESTLFRARKRLTEEYDELVSGARCERIQSIIVSAGASTPGARDSRRLARHIAHCQPCRRQAMASGLDVAAIAGKPLRRRAVERAAAFLPLPGFLRSRAWAGGEHIVPVSEPMAAAWSKAVAAAATLIVAGVGAGVAPHGGSGTPQPAKHAKPVSERTAKAPAGARTTSTSAGSATTLRSTRTRTTKSRAGSRRSASLGGSRRTAHSRDTAAPRSSAPSGGSRPAGASAPTAPAAVNPGRAAPQPTRGVHAPTAGGGGQDTPTPPRLPSGNVPLSPPVSPNQAGGQVTQTVEQTGTAVTDTAAGVTDTVDDVTDSLPDVGG